MSDDYEVEELYADDGGTFDRQELLRRGAAAGLAIPTISLLFGANAAFARPSARALTPTFYQWIYNIHPDIPDTLNKQYATKHQLDAKIAPVQGFGIERFVAEAKQKKSTWDVYVGMTPFVEMAQLIAAGVIEPWDTYMPAAVKKTSSLRFSTRSPTRGTSGRGRSCSTSSSRPGMPSSCRRPSSTRSTPRSPGTS